MIKFIVAALLLTTNAFGGLPPTTLKGQGGSNVTTFGFQVPLNQATQVSGVNSLIETGNKNILQNPGFEGTGDWTASGGATTAINTTAVGTGANGYDWNSNGASQTLSSDSVTIPAGLLGKSGVVSCAIKTVSGTATHTLQAYDGSNIVGTATITSTTASFARTALNFVFPTSGSIVLRLVSVAADEPEIYIDDCYMGLAEGFNIGAISQVGEWTSYGSASSYTGFGTVTSTVLEYRTEPQGVRIRARGTFGTPTATEARLALPSGCTSLSTYATVDYTGITITNVAGRTLTNLIEPSVTYLTFGDNPTSNALTKRNGDTLVSAGNTFALEAYVKCQGYSSNTIYRPEQSAAYYSGYHDSTCVWARTNTAFGDFTADASCALVTRKSSGITATATGSVLPAIALTLPKTGQYFVCAAPRNYSDANGYGHIRLWDGTTVVSTALTYIASDVSTPSICGIYDATTLTPTLTLQGKSAGSTINITGATTDPAIEWSIFPITGNMPAPVLVGSVTSNSATAQRMEYISVTSTCTTGTCTTASSSGSAITNVTWTSTGQYSVNFPVGTWSAAPICVITSAGGTHGFQMNTTSTTAFTFVSFTPSSGSASNSNFNIICTGPR